MSPPTYRQKPSEAIDYFVPIAAGATILVSSWKITPEAPLSPGIDDASGSICRVRDGLKYGLMYRLVCNIVFLGGVMLDSEASIICDHR